ncbi:PKD domain-containing protein [Chitinophaga barathri]|uniref:PKD domain-containing protein n=1 Tax=Chitinophaga barathri TaxID=1647451 RepID=A0A3N4M543_9BACT|nr:PKD domain-containing protein [Chitinophaga barathri]RPD38311.1 hypothetical protein EG028_25835 [Chitinophaga barathri]
MANTHGFEVIAQLTVPALKQLLLAAWKSGGDASGPGVIPEYVNIPNTISFGPYQVASGHVQIPKEQLDLEMDTGVNGVRIKLGTINHIEIANPPIDAAKLFDITADVHVRVPIREINTANHEIGADFTAMPADAVSVSITSGDPIAPITTAAIEEFVHKKYQEGAIPSQITPDPTISFGPFSMKVHTELYDDVNDPARKITIEKPDPTHVKVIIPCYLRFYDITGSLAGFSLRTPMGITGKAVMLAEYTEAADRIFVKTSTATVTLENVTPASGDEGSNYTFNKNAASIGGYDLEALIKTNFSSAAAGPLHAFGDVEVFVPTMAQIEGFIAARVRDELVARQKIQVWKVEDPTGTTTINDVTPQAYSNGFALCINGGGGGNPGAVTSFVPAGRDFAIATSEAKVRQEFNETVADQYGTLPTTLDEPVEGKTVKLNSIGLDLLTGELSVNGEVTIVDAVLDSIDIDAGFDQKVKLKWVDKSDGTQMLEHELIGDPDVDLGAGAWLLVAFLGFLTFGIIGLIIGLIIMAVVESIASKIGGVVAKDESGKVTGIGAWPGSLDAIGNVQARFENPVVIEPSGLVFAGNMIITSTHALTSEDMARSHGPYNVTGNAFVNFNGGADKPTSKAHWLAGDGASFTLRNVSHRFGKSGVYVARVQIQVDETGGATTKHYTRVNVKNVAPVVSFELPVITVEEGEKVTLKAVFTDDNWLDTHKAVIDFGDNTAPQTLSVTETNKEPQAQGTASAEHAWCDNGTYTVRLTVQDSAGGVGEAVMTVNVTNVAPKVFTYKRLCVLRNQPVRLDAVFIDAGWCDSHVGTWDSGDGHIKMATIREKNKSPQGVGIASASHVYTCKGNYVAKVTVQDDDGGVGMAYSLVTVTELQNADFEGGFRYKPQKEARNTQEDAIVANEWQPFASPVLIIDPENSNVPPFKAAYFIPDEFICRDGQRAQGVTIEGSGIAGIRQSICANCGWDYEFTTFYHLPTRSRGMARIGIDPNGGTNPVSEDIVWVEAAAVDEWVHMSVRVTALKSRITCFIAVYQENGESELYIDRAALFMIQACDPYPLIMRPKDRQDCCPVDELERHDFDKLEKYMSDDIAMYYPGTAAYRASMSGVRMVDENNPPPAFRLDKQSGEQLMNMAVSGAIQLTTGIAKTLIKGTIGRILPFGKRG